MRQCAIVNLGAVDGAVQFPPKTIQKMRMLLKPLLVGLKVMCQIRRQIAFMHIHGMRLYHIHLNGFLTVTEPYVWPSFISSLQTISHEAASAAAMMSESQ